MNDPLGHVGADRIALGQTTGNATLDALAIASGAASMSLVIEWVILAGIALFFTSLRTFARARVMGLRGFKWDDFLVWVALVSTTTLGRLGGIQLGTDHKTNLHDYSNRLLIAA